MDERTEMIHFRANTTERKALENLAKMDGRRSVSEAIRELVRTETQRRGAWPTASNTERPAGMA